MRGRHRGRQLEVLVDISSIDLRYERCRLQHAGGERRLLLQISEVGIREPLQGMSKDDRHVLLDGFKRWRCAKKLGLASVPFRSLDKDEAMAIIALMRRANAQSLTIMEQACLIDELKRVHGFTTGEIAKRLERSAAWVSMRSGVVGEMPEAVRVLVMRGEFPIYAYMYYVRQFMRMNGSQPGDAESFVSVTAGKGLSQRDIGVLASAYFKGGEEVRREIARGNLGFCLDALSRSEVAQVGLNAAEQRVISDLDLVGRRMRRLDYSLRNEQLTTGGFFAQGHILSGGILRIIAAFTEQVRGLYDRSRSQESDRHVIQAGHEHPPNYSAPGCEPQQRPHNSKSGRGGKDITTLR